MKGSESFRDWWRVRGRRDGATRNWVLAITCFYWTALSLHAGPCVKFDAVEWATEFGTSSDDFVRDAAVDQHGNLYAVGWTHGVMHGQNPPNGPNDSFIMKFSQAGVLQWVRQFGTTAADRIIGVAVDHSGDIFVSGITFAAMPEQEFFGGLSDAYLARFSPDGDKLWLKQFGTNATDQGYRVAVDSRGNVLVTGTTWGQFPGETKYGPIDTFLAKFTNNGEKIWIRQFGTAGGDSGPGLAIDADDHIYVGGYTTDDFAGQEGPPGVNAFLARFLPDGTKRWVRQLGSGENTIGAYVAVDGLGGVYLTGNTRGSLPGEVGAGEADAFVAKYNVEGDLQWVRQLGTEGDDFAFGIAARSDGGVFITGFVSGALPNQQHLGKSDVFVAHYQPDGSLAWLSQFGSSQLDVGRVIKLDQNDRIVVAGFTEGSISGQLTLGGKSAFVVGFGTCLRTPGDLTGSGVIDVKDLLLLLEGWGPCEFTFDCPADINGDGYVDIFDLLLLLENWG